MIPRAAVFSAVLLGIVSGGMAFAGPTTSHKCAATKLKATATKTTCLLSLEAQEAQNATAKDPLKVAACMTRFTGAFAAAEAKAPCATSGDAAEIEAKVDAFVGDLDTTLSASLPNTCQATKIRSVSREQKCLLRLEAREAQSGVSKDPVKVQRCVDKLTASFQKADAGGGCGTTNDASASASKVDAFVNDVAGDLKPGIGTNYYVDATAGDDRASGTQPSAAWRTVARVNSAAFQPGDRVLFKRGGVWREQLNVNDSGVSGSPIVFGTYGEGDAPVLWGADCVSAACDLGANRWSPAGGSNPIYRAAVNWKAGVFLLDGTPLRFVAWTSTIPADMWARMSPGTWAFDYRNFVAYLWMPDGSAPDGRIVEAARRDYNIYTAGAHDIMVDGLSLRAGTLACVLTYGAVSWTFDHMDVRFCGGRFKDEDPTHTFYLGNGFEISNGSSDVLIRNSIVGDVFDSGISSQLYTPSGSVQNVTIDATEIFNTPLAGIEIVVWSDQSTMQGITVKNSFIHDAGRGWSMDENPNRPSGTGIWSTVGPGLQSSISGIVVEDSTVTNNVLDGVVLAYNTGVTRIERNTITGNQYGIGFYDDQSTTLTGGVVLNNDNSGNFETGLCFSVPNSSTSLQAAGNTAPAYCPATLAQHIAKYQ